MVMAAAIVMAVAAAAKTASDSIEQNRRLDQQTKGAMYSKSIAETNAGNAARASEVEGQDARRESRQRLGQMRASFGANGIDIAGSPLDVLQDTAAEGELTAQRKEYGGKVQAVNFRNQANLYQYEADTYQANKKSGGSIAFNSLVAGGMAFVSTYAAGGDFSNLGSSADVVNTADGVGYTESARSGMDGAFARAGN